MISVPPPARAEGRVRKTNSSGMNEKDLLQGKQGRDLPNQPPSKENTRFIPLKCPGPSPEEHLPKRGRAALPHLLP